MKKTSIFLTIAAAAITLAACNRNPQVEYFYYEPEDYELLSEHLNLPAVPPVYTAELPTHLARQGLFARPVNSNKATLGRVLFYDKNLSKDKTISCGSCHQQSLGFGDNKAVSAGVYDRQGERNSIALSSVANFSAYYGTDLNGSSAIRFFWDNRAETASLQATGSMNNPLEMDMHANDIVAAVNSQPYYKPLLKKAFPDNDQVTFEMITDAISNFTNAMGSYQSRFDAGANKLAEQYSYLTVEQLANIDFDNLSVAENRGKTVYMNSCSGCHSPSFGRPMLQFANNGLDEATGADQGVGGISNNSSEMGAFKVPTLRNVELSAPYMHDGRFATLEEVVDHYSTGIKNHPNLHFELKANGQAKKFNFTAQQKADLVAFLKATTDEHLLTDVKFSDPFLR
jgi:cytochrome c peroxidase